MPNPDPSVIVKAYRKRQNMTMRSFAMAVGTSAATVNYWEKRTYKPDHAFLMRLVLQTSDWRRDFALDCLAAMDPQVYQPATNTGR